MYLLTRYLVFLDCFVYLYRKFDLQTLSPFPLHPVEGFHWSQPTAQHTPNLSISVSPTPYTSTLTHVFFDGGFCVVRHVVLSTRRPFVCEAPFLSALLQLPKSGHLLLMVSCGLLIQGCHLLLLLSRKVGVIYLFVLDWFFFYVFESVDVYLFFYW